MSNTWDAAKIVKQISNLIYLIELRNSRQLKKHRQSLKIRESRKNFDIVISHSSPSCEEVDEAEEFYDCEDLNPNETLPVATRTRSKLVILDE